MGAMPDRTSKSDWSLRGTHVLVADDDEDIRALVCDVLRRADAVPLPAHDGADAVDVFHRHHPDLVVLDVDMPRANGWIALERIRAVSRRPVLMLTADDRELTATRALRAGADDYVRKPFGSLELLARLGALARTAQPEGIADLAHVYRDRHLELDFRNCEARTPDGRVIPLRPVEYRLLEALARRPGKLVSPAQLRLDVWHDDVGAAKLKVHMSYLRSRLREAGVDPGIIQTLRGYGYRYRPTPSGEAAAEG
jgi:DNA-binding response OmpR family regulator